MYVCAQGRGEGVRYLSSVETNMECIQNKDKVEDKDWLKDKNKYFILVLLSMWFMIPVYDDYMLFMILVYDGYMWFVMLIYDGCFLS